jgi:glycosyltransferase involved in cell wall biosynthesis
LGLPAQESLTCGKVCLVSNTLPVAREIDNCALVRIAPDDFFGWREALRTWLENVPMRRAFEIQARAYAPPSWSEIAEAIARF